MLCSPSVPLLNPNRLDAAWEMHSGALSTPINRLAIFSFPVLKLGALTMNTRVVYIHEVTSRPWNMAQN